MNTATRNRAGRWRVLLVVLAVCLASVATPAAAVAAGSSTPAGCSPANDAIGAVTGVPVVYVHGWTSSAATSAPVVRVLRGSLGPGYTVTAFDYGPTSTAWPDGTTARCLAAYLTRVWVAGGKRNKVVVVAHSMGGIATRFASQLPADQFPITDVLAGVVTLATPHRGTPWGDTAAAKFVESWGPGSLPPGGTSAEVCLADLNRRTYPPCATPPYLPDGIALAQIGTQITVRRTLFDLGPFKKAADISLFGDAVVPADSAGGYLGSVPRQSASRIATSITSIPCLYTTDYLLAYKVGASTGGGGAGSIVGGELAVLGNIWADNKALDDITAGRASLAVAQLSGFTYFTDCFHTKMTTKPHVVAAATAAIKTFNTAASIAPPTGLTAARKNFSGSLFVVVTWATPAGSPVAVTGYEITTAGKAYSGVQTVQGTTYMDGTAGAQTNYCSPTVKYTVRSLGKDGARSAPATATVNDAVDCTPVTVVSSAIANTDGSVAVQVDCQSSGRSPDANSPIVILFNKTIKDAGTQVCLHSGAGHDLHAYTITGLARGTTYAVTARTTSLTGTKTSLPGSVQTSP